MPVIYLDILSDLVSYTLMKTPVVRTRRRRDGWTPERQRAFLLALRDTGSIAGALASVGLSRVSLHRLRNRPDAKHFEAALHAACAAARAAKAPPIEATSKPVIWDGRQVAIRTRFTGMTHPQPPRDWLAEAARHLHLVNFRPLGDGGESPPQTSNMLTSAPAPLAPTPRVP